MSADDRASRSGGSAEPGDAPLGPVGPPAASGVEAHVRGAWQAWLASLATDANAATVAAELYSELPGDARDAWIAALAEDAPDLGVPSAALYGPLLAVESDPSRHDRMERAANTTLGPITEVKRALLGTARGGVRVAVLVIPLYLDFVRVLVFRMVKDRGFDWVRQLPIVREGDAPDQGAVIDEVKLYASSRDAVVDELAHAVLAQRRAGRELPQMLRDCADLFSAALLGDEVR